MFERFPFILDGATGTELAKRGMPAGVSTELWAMEHPDAAASVYRGYAEAGSDAVLACTFGANTVKLAHYGLEKRANELNAFHVELAKKTAPGHFVLGDISSTGEFLEPLGSLTFDELADSYGQQAAALEKAGADAVLIETMIDVQQTRAAIFGVAKYTGLKALASLSFENGRTLTGSSPECTAITLQAAGAAAVGANCGAGPEQMLPVIEKMAPFVQIPLIAKPNAGLPRLVDGKTVYDMPPEAFARGMEALVGAGARIIGGCCGTTPEHIAAIAPLKQRVLKPVYGNIENAVCSRLKHMEYSADIDITRFELNDGFDEDELLDEEAEAKLLCLCGSPSPETVKHALLTLSGSAVLAFELESSAALEAALRYYCGRAVVFGGGKNLCARYGALMG